MNIDDINEKYENRLCLLGNIEVDTLIRGNPGDIERLVIEKLNSVLQKMDFMPMAPVIQSQTKCLLRI